MNSGGFGMSSCLLSSPSSLGINGEAALRGQDGCDFNER